MPRRAKSEGSIFLEKFQGSFWLEDSGGGVPSKPFQCDDMSVIGAKDMRPGLKCNGDNLVVIRIREHDVAYIYRL